MANLGRPHATIRRTQKNYIISIVKNYIRIQKTIHVNLATDESVKLMATNLEELVAKSPDEKFAAAKYLMEELGGLPYAPDWSDNFWKTVNSEYYNWVLEETRKRLCGFSY